MKKEYNIYNDIWDIDGYYFYAKGNLIVYGDESDTPLSLGISRTDLRKRLNKKVQHVAEIHTNKLELERSLLKKNNRS